MSTAAQSQPNSNTRVVQGLEWGVLAAYAVAILSQFPMLYLYAKRLISEPHYHSVLFAIAATIVIALVRWPWNRAVQLQKSATSNTLLVLALLAVTFSILFVQPWMSALSAMLIVTSFLARVPGSETNGGSLWYVSLPLYVFLYLPFGMDRNLVTTLQVYSANYTSRLLDLLNVGHHMSGTVLNVPNMDQFGIEQACSGVQSFFTLVSVAVVYSVWNRQVKAPEKGIAILSFLIALIFLLIRTIPKAIFAVDMPVFWSVLLFLLAISLMLYAFIGFRTTLLVMSAVFWAIFMNTIRIMAIPVSMKFFEFDLAHGNAHTLLGYASLIVGITLILSTDQLILFFFGPVEDAEESGRFGRVIGKMWNGLIPDSSKQATSSRGRSKRSRQPVPPSVQKALWVFASVMLFAGVWQLWDVRQCVLQADKKLSVRVFDGDVTVPFSEGDIPQEIENWTRISFKTNQRNAGSDFGERSDVWQYKAPSCYATASLDQTFPGWHELTTCYTNTGWKIIDRKALTRAQALGRKSSDDSGGDDWDMIEVTMQKPTGERGYLLFSHFDSFGQGLAVPKSWNTINGFFTRMINRLSHRIRATLVQSEAYQIQVFLNSYSDFNPTVITEARQRYVRIRDEVRKQFLDKLASAPEA